MFIPSSVAATAQAFKASIDKGSVEAHGQGAQECGGAGATDVATCIVEGGVAPYSYLWELSSVQAEKGPWLPTASTSDATAWNASGIVCNLDNPDTELWDCTVTDDIGAVSVAQVSVRIRWTDIT